MGGFTRDLVVFLLLLLPLASSATSLQDALSNATAALGIGDVQLPHPETVTGAWKDLVTLLDAHRGDSKQAVLTLKSYFSRFGYLNASSISNATMDFDDELEAAVRLYQQNFKLRVTGTLDLATISQLVKPRCGCQDVLSGVSQMVSTNRSMMAHTVQRYTFFTGQPKWTSDKHLSYFIDYPSLPSSNSLSAGQVQAAIGNAFSEWSAIVPLTFSETSTRSSADITIGFGSFDHGDKQPFDGQLGVLAHAFAPEDGRLHFDASETWVADLKSDTSLTAMHFQSVATHEIGHLIGLGHTNDQTAIMFPSIGAREVRTSFSEDDVQGAQQLYGANPSYQPGSLQGTDSTIMTSGDIGESHRLWWWTGIAATIAVFLTSC